MFWYYLSNTPFLKKHQTFLRVLVNIFRFYFLVVFFIDVFGLLFLQIYFNGNIYGAKAYIYNMSDIARFFLIHSFWLLVFLLVFEIVIIFIAMAENARNNYYRGEVLLQVIQEKWRFIIPIAMTFSFGIFALLVTLSFHPAFGISVFLLCFKLLLDPLIHYVALTTNGVLISRVFNDTFFPFDKLYPYSDKEVKLFLKNSVFSLKFSNTTDENFAIELQCPYSNLEALINLYQEKTKEAQRT